MFKYVCDMGKSIIDSVIRDQINRYGKRHIVKRYSIMLGELTRTAYELEDLQRGCVLMDIEEVLKCIIEGVNNE